VKKKILIIIALIMIISTIIRTSIVGASFLTYSNSLISNQTKLIVEILKEAKDKDKFLSVINSSHPIQEISFINNKKEDIIYSFKDKTIISYTPFDNSKSLKIVFSAKDYFDNLINSVIQLILIALISLIIIILLLNHFLEPYLEILEEINKTTKRILKGNFNNKIYLNLKGEAKEFVNSYNYFLQKLKESFGVIEEKYTTLIEKEKTQDPLNDVKDTIEHLADIFEFKKLVEVDDSYKTIIERFALILKEFNIKNFAIIHLNETPKVLYKTGDICCKVLQNPKSCRVYRTKQEVNSTKIKNICLVHTCESEYICMPLSSNLNMILKIMLEENAAQIKKILPYIKAYINEISSIIESKYNLEMLQNQNIKDSLTNLYNRRYLEGIIDKLTKENSVGFLMLDMDYFKDVNDTYGHDAGDLVLKQLAKIIKNNIKKTDIPIRMGGEEFLIILPNTNEEELKEVAFKLNKIIKKTPFFINESDYIHKSVSIGASLYPKNCKNATDCIKKADKALYEAKKKRNCVVIS